MKRNPRKLATWLTSVALVMAFGGALLLLSSMHARDTLPPVEFFKLAVEIYKTAIAGTVVALLGALVPLAFKVSRENFEQRKEARLAYSEAKTGVDYLRLRLSTLPLAEAASVLQTVHVKKHLAETYPELEEYLHGVLIGAWGTEMWKKLDACRQVLEKHANQWNDWVPQQRLEALQSSESIAAPRAA